MIRGGRTHRNWNQRASPDRATVTAWGGATQNWHGPREGPHKAMGRKSMRIMSPLLFTFEFHSFVIGVLCSLSVLSERRAGRTTETEFASTIQICELLL
jgi:hypothetical protein